MYVHIYVSNWLIKFMYFLEQSSFLRTCRVHHTIPLKRLSGVNEALLLTVMRWVIHAYSGTSTLIKPCATCFTEPELSVSSRSLDDSRLLRA